MTLQTLNDLEHELKALMQNAKDKQLRGTELSYIAVEGVDDETPVLWRKRHKPEKRSVTTSKGLEGCRDVGGAP